MIEQQHADQFADWFHSLVENIGVVIKGKNDEIGMVLVAVLSEGHILLEDHPGTGKTSLAKSLAQLFRGEFKRVQFTPDLLPADVTGTMMYNPRTGEFSHRKGPVFANVLLADEINRASPKTQASLLEAMEERQVTTGTETYRLPRPFVVIATQNPDEAMSGTYELPAAQLDRFLMKLSVGYPLHEHEMDMLKSDSDGVRPELLPKLMDVESLAKLIDVASLVHVNDRIRQYLVDIAHVSRDRDVMPQINVGLSPRGVIALMRASRTLAASQGRTFVRADDVKTVAHSVIGHRLLLTAKAEMDRNVTTTDLVEEILTKVATPDEARVR